MNRIENRKDGSEEAPAGDYYVVGSDDCFFWVDEGMAARLSRALSRLWQRRWVGLVDRNGSRAWIRAGLVEFIQESTTLQRERSRAFHRARREEAKAERRWDEDYE